MRVDDANKPAFPRWPVIILIVAATGVIAAALSVGAFRVFGEGWEHDTERASRAWSREEAPAIVWGTPIGHADRGPCTTCHNVVFAQGTRLPSISALSTMPHAFRGMCNNCHEIIAPSLRGVVPIAATSNRAWR